MYTDITLFDTYNGFYITQIPTSHLAGSLPHITFDQFKKKCIYIYDNRYDYSESIFTNLCDPLTIKCNNSGEYYTVRRAYDHLNMSAICPCCNDVMLGENRIMKILKKHDIKYERQYLFKDFGSYELFDFYLPEKGCCIEYKSSNNKKIEYCEENFINLIIININNIEDIEDIIINNLL